MACLWECQRARGTTALVAASQQTDGQTDGRVWQTTEAPRAEERSTAMPASGHGHYTSNVCLLSVALCCAAPALSADCVSPHGLSADVGGLTALSQTNARI